MFADIWVRNCLYSMLPPNCISQVQASTHRKVKLNPKSPSTKKLYECLLIFGWKIVSIQCCPLIVYPRFRPRLKERLRSTEKAHQQKMCVNVCWYSGEKLSLFNVAPIVYSKFRPRLNERLAQPKSPSPKILCVCLLIFGWKTVSIQCCPILYIPGLGLDS